MVVDRRASGFEDGILLDFLRGKGGDWELMAMAMAMAIVELWW